MEKKHFEQKLSQLETPYNNIKGYWQDLANHFLPRQCRFLVDDVNKAPKVSKKIKDSATVIAVRTFSSGMMSGATNPSRKWFKLAVQNYKNPAGYAVRNWCADTATLFSDIFHSSNVYQNLPQAYKQMGTFGISSICVEKDFDSVITTKVLPIGSYRIGRNYKGKVDTLYRLYSETAKNLVEKFGEENVSDKVKTAAQNDGQNQQLFEIVHAVEPNSDYVKDSKWAKNKKYISVYYERSNREDKFLSQSGFDYFPYVVFDAEINGEDVYPSNCPGMDALPDAKQLMSLTMDYGIAVKKMVSPPTQGPASLAGKMLSWNPDAFNATMNNTGSDGIKPIYEVNPRVLEIKSDINEIKEVIRSHFYNDLFAMILETSRRQRTATEIDELKEEKLILLSPLLEQVHSGLKDLMDITFQISNEAGILPPPPPEIQGAAIKIEFVSTLAQAMKVNNISSMERFLTFTGNMAATFDPNARLKVDIYKVIDDYADFANIDPDQIVPTEIALQQVEALRQQQAAAQAAESLRTGSEIIKNMGGADASGGNLLERIGLA